MMGDVLKGLKYEREELDPDITCDYNFILGDLNYRFESSYEEMIDENLIQQAPQLIETHDQLKISMRGGFIPIKMANGDEIARMSSPKYPHYQEPKINFFPTYKRNDQDNGYVNKKSQAPSYCDRILFKNNTSNRHQVISYGCNDNIFGSDHRPVSLSMVIKSKRVDDN